MDLVCVSVCISVSHHRHARCLQKRKAKVFLNITLKFVNKFPSNLARCVSYVYLTTWLKIIHFTSRMYTHYLVKL